MPGLGLCQGDYGSLATGGTRISNPRFGPSRGGATVWYFDCARQDLGSAAARISTAALSAARGASRQSGSRGARPVERG
ncbi:hypothetical protein Acsp02_04340 [Actinoplanes sp. NBRC 103695]|nr:hypothetical protein Acsp02_04340 [Actinoplanes sp. NBRC 103695]